MRAFVTGAEGFAGSHLIEFLIREGFETSGIYYSEQSFEPVKGILTDAKLVECDVRDRDKLDRIVSEAVPEIVFHLAALASVPLNERNRTLSIETNFVGSCNLLDAVRGGAPEARTIMISSSEVYGKVAPEQLPLDENDPVKPANFYGVTKASVELLSRFYVTRYGMDIVILRPFNHIGPRQGTAFVCADFASQIAKIERGLMPPLMNVGDLTVERDFTDVRDMVKGYLFAARKGRAGEIYTLCSGTAHRIQEVLDILLDHAEVPVEVDQDPAKLRPSEIPVLMGSYEKFKQATGWSPEIPFETTVRDTLDHWRRQIGSGPSV